METTLRNKLKGVIRAKVEGYLKENSIKFIRKPLNEKTQGEIDAEKEEMTQRIKTKQEQIKALNDQVKVLQGILGKLGSEKADEV
jgi:ABC-type phosphate transport system auxiliary subunit